jgi:hypothetical protein
MRDGVEYGGTCPISGLVQATSTPLWPGPSGDTPSPSAAIVAAAHAAYVHTAGGDRAVALALRALD